MVGSAAEGHPKASGWMTSSNFLSYLRHFTKFSRPSTAFPVLLLLDNHSSHVSLDAIDYCKANNIVLLSFPPHCSHELQPLDKTVYGPFKTFYNKAADDWMRKPVNAGKAITIHQIPLFITQAFSKAFSQENIKSGFESTGIQPLNSDRIPDDRYLTSYVTEQPDIAETEAETPQIQLIDQTDPAEQTDQPGPSSLVSPEMIRPFGKAPRRKTNRKKKVTSLIYTSSPVKRMLEEESQKRGSRKESNKKQKCKKSILQADPASSGSEDSDNEESVNEQLLVVDDDSDVNITDVFLGDERDLHNEGDVLKLNVVENVDVGDYVVVQIATKSVSKLFVAMIKTPRDEDDEVEVEFFKRKGGYFVQPVPQDLANVHIDNIKAVLPPPNMRGTTKRTQGELIFPTDFGDLNLC